MSLPNKRGNSSRTIPLFGFSLDNFRCPNSIFAKKYKKSRRPSPDRRANIIFFQYYLKVKELRIVLEKTIRAHDVGKVVFDTFGESNLSLVIVENTIVLTCAAPQKSVSDLALASESVLAKDWLLPEEDEAWKFL